MCIVAIQACKAGGLITFRNFNTDEAKKCKSGVGEGILFQWTDRLSFI